MTKTEKEAKKGKRKKSKVLRPPGLVVFGGVVTMVALMWFALACVFVAPALAADQAARERDFQSKVQPLLKKYCGDCHGGGVSEGDLDLERFKSARDVLRGREHWLKVLQKLGVSVMPPKDAEQPSPAERKLLMAWGGFLIT